MVMGFHEGGRTWVQSQDLTFWKEFYFVHTSRYSAQCCCSQKLPARERKQSHAHTQTFGHGQGVDKIRCTNTQNFITNTNLFRVRMLPFVAVSSDQSRITVHLQFKTPASLFCTGVNLSNILNYRSIIWCITWSYFIMSSDE